MSQEVIEARNKIEKDLLDAIAKAVQSGEANAAEQWTHAYVQFAQALGIARQ